MDDADGIVTSLQTLEKIKRKGKNVKLENLLHLKSINNKYYFKIINKIKQQNIKYKI